MDIFNYKSLRLSGRKLGITLILHSSYFQVVGSLNYKVWGKMACVNNNKAIFNLDLPYTTGSHLVLNFKVRVEAVFITS